ncbi:hypothetical protein GlitD10_0743 [Gloeomargarita lithophora Alchichica-D10]|uniref:Uncharacterized protein n=1 Tax=Gloeomargarita lithophora Alchichica-D10 TaxID=1188229 RepID=A0A1J0AAX7_9CYAN|nr:hypothetical protein [Gloeomargarita lithophora]APB33057.1 hypothetical protein GlitD10_0743 [Gloeomargarita lithophora Alchichica-D10]
MPAPSTSSSVARRPTQVPPHRELFWGFVIQGLVCAGMAVALVRLIPYHRQQQQRNQVVQTELERTETQVQQLQTQFQRTFDPQQQPRLVQKATQRLQPQQRQVIWVAPQ